MNKLYPVGVLLAIAMSAHAQAPSARITLEEAWRIAEERSVAVVAARASMTTAEGRSADTRGLFWNNPELSAEAIQRRIQNSPIGATTAREWSAGVSQIIEIAGQPGYRRQAALDELTAARHQLDEARLRLRAEVERRFVQVLALQLRVANEREFLDLVERNAAFAAKRVDAGEGSKLEGNVARVEAGRARSQLAVLEDQLTQARNEMGAVVQLPPGGFPEVAGDLETTEVPVMLAELLDRSAQRPRLAEAAARESAARNRLDLERAARYPDVTLGFRVAREGVAEFRENVSAVNISLPLPLFKRNAGNIAQASAELSRAEAERRAGERDLQALVRSLWQRREILRARVQALKADVLPALADNQRLSQRALQEGEIAQAELVIINRQLVEGRRDLLDALAELRLVHVAIEEATGFVLDARSRSPG